MHADVANRFCNVVRLDGRALTAMDTVINFMGAQDSGEADGREATIPRLKPAVKLGTLGAS